MTNMASFSQSAIPTSQSSLPTEKGSAIPQVVSPKDQDNVGLVGFAFEKVPMFIYTEGNPQSAVIPHPVEGCEIKIFRVGSAQDAVRTWILIHALTQTLQPIPQEIVEMTVIWRKGETGIKEVTLDLPRLIRYEPVRLLLKMEIEPGAPVRQAVGRDKAELLIINDLTSPYGPASDDYLLNFATTTNHNSLSLHPSVTPSTIGGYGERPNR
jgi:hypothetical protein